MIYPTATISRRSLLLGVSASATLSCCPAIRARDNETTLLDRIAGFERQRGGRIGVTILDVATGRSIAFRGQERFPLCSTYKLLAAAFVLARVDRTQERLDRRVAYSRDALVTYSPVTENHAGTAGMTVGELCDAAVTWSDNTAGNLLVESFGGPVLLTGYLRSLGDEVTRLDRYEPFLNTALPDDPRDTTTPDAMAGLMLRLLFQPVLSPASRDQLEAWLVECRTGDSRLRAGVPAGWRTGDKTGAGDNNTTNDVAVFWPPNRSPMIVTAYYTGSDSTSAQRNDTLRQIGGLVAD